MPNASYYNPQDDDYEDLGPAESQAALEGLRPDDGRFLPKRKNTITIEEIQQWRRDMGIPDPDDFYSGGVDRGADFHPVKDEITETTETSRPRRFRSRAEDAKAPPPRWLIEGLIPENADVALYAPFGFGKSFLMLDLAYSVATGQPALGQFAVNSSGPVFVFAGEGHGSMVAKRAVGWEVEHGFEPYHVENIYFGEGVPLTTDNEAIEEDIHEIEFILEGRRAQLFVIDTMNRALNGMDEDKSHTASKYLNTIKGIRSRIGGTSLTIAHMGKDVERGERGSSAFAAGFDTILWITKWVQNDDGTHMMEILVRKQKDGEDGRKFYMRSKKVMTQNGDTLVLIPVSEDEAKSSLQTKRSTAIDVEDVRAALKQCYPHGEPITTTALVDVLSKLCPDKAVKTIRNTLSTHNKEGGKFHQFVHGEPFDGMWRLPMKDHDGHALQELIGEKGWKKNGSLSHPDLSR